MTKSFCDSNPVKCSGASQKFWPFCQRVVITLRHAVCVQNVFPIKAIFVKIQLQYYEQRPSFPPWSCKRRQVSGRETRLIIAWMLRPKQSVIRSHKLVLHKSQTLWPQHQTSAECQHRISQTTTLNPSRRRRQQIRHKQPGTHTPGF